MITNLKLAFISIIVLLLATSLSARQVTPALKTDTVPVKRDTVLIKHDSIPARHHIAVFAPLYLDSAFDAAGNYRYDKNFPKYISQGLEFWEGIQLAIDSLQHEGIQLDVHVYDTRSVKTRFETVIAGEEIKQMNLIIGHVTINEAAQLAALANQMGIPFINANMPNNASVTNNPHFVVLNSTLLTHCTGLYKFMQKNFSLSNIVVFSKKGVQEDKLKEYFTQVEKSTSSVPLKLKYITVNPNVTTQQLRVYLDSTTTNICLVPSMDIFFGQTICSDLSALSSSYASIVVGMPTWDVIDFEKDQFKGIEVYYSTPFYINPADKIANNVQETYKSSFFSRPSDMVFRGFQTLYHFAHLLKLYDQNISSSLGDKKFMLFNEFDIQPVLGKQTLTLDYFENKKLYYVRKVDGVVKAVY
jgi:hypothetical protein